MSVGGRLSVEGRQTIRERLVTEVGGYLRNVIREQRVTCAVCATPVRAAFMQCRRCERDRDAFGDELADLVVPLCYGVRGNQSGYLMHSYKDLEAPARHNQTLLSMILLAALDRHGGCIERRLGDRLDAWAIVPSARTDRPGEHPLHVVAMRAGILLPEIRLDAQPSSQDRATSPQRFAVHGGGDANGRHVLLIEDTWTSGGNAQSAALTLRRADVASVTILALARWLNPDESPTSSFVARRLDTDYDPLTCPLDGSDCLR